MEIEDDSQLKPNDGPKVRCYFMGKQTIDGIKMSPIFIDFSNKYKPPNWLRRKLTWLIMGSVWEIVP